MSELSLEVLKGLLIIAAGLVVILGSVRLLNFISARNSLPTNIIYLIKAVIRWSVIVIVLSLVLALFGMSIKTLWTALLSVMVLVAVAFFAGWSVLSNLLCSLLLLLFSRVRIGDTVELKDTKHADQGVRGKIVDINLFFVTLQELEHDAYLPDVLPTMQIPCHLFFFKVVRCWQGDDTQPLKTSFNDANNSVNKVEQNHNA